MLVIIIMMVMIIVMMLMMVMTMMTMLALMVKYLIKCLPSLSNPDMPQQWINVSILVPERTLFLQGYPSPTVGD